MSQLSFQVKIHAHYKTNVEDLFEEMFDLAKRLNADISGSHSWQNVLVSPSGYATVEVPWGEPRYTFYRRRVASAVKSLGVGQTMVVWDKVVGGEGSVGQ